MAGVTWKMWFIGCYGFFCCILLLQSWPVDGLRLTVAETLHHRGRHLLQSAPVPSASKPSPPPASTSPPEPPASLPPETPAPPPVSVTPPPSQPSASPPPSTSPPPSASPPPASPPASPPPELAASSPPASPSPPVSPPSESPPPPPSMALLSPPFPAPSVSATPDTPPPSTTPTSPPPSPLDAPPPSVPASPPPAVPDSPPPAVPNSPPPVVPDSPPPAVPPSVTPVSPPPAVKDAPPPSTPNAPPPSDAPPTPPPVDPPASPPPTSPPPASTPPPSAPPVSASPPDRTTTPPATPPSAPPATSPPAPPSQPPTEPPPPPSPIAPGPSPTESPPGVVLPPPPSTAPPPSPNSPPPSNPNSPPPASPPSNSNSPPPASPPSNSNSPPPDAPPPASPPSNSNSLPPDAPPPASPPPNFNSPPASPKSPPPPPPDSPAPASPKSPPPAPSPRSPPAAAPPPANLSATPPSSPPPPPLAPPPTAVPPPPPPSSPVATSPPSSPPAVPPPPPSILAPPPYVLAPGPAVQGCCTANMMLRPGSVGTVQCECVYPITVKLQFTNASSSTPNLQDIFQTNLAVSLGLLDVQVLVNYFKFGKNSSFSVKAAAEDGPLNVESDVGSTSGMSFSYADITRINQTIWSRNVKFNSTYFGPYSVISVTPEFIPSAAAPESVAATPPTKAVAPAPSKSSSNVALYAGIAGGVGVLVLCILLALCIWRILHWKKRNKTSEGGANSSKVSSVPSHQLVAAPTRWVPADSKSFPRPKQTREFTYEELSEATNGFAPSAFIGEGGFGKVYRGVLRDGTEVAIKKLTTGGHQGDREFLVEVEMLSRLHHRHLVKLLGYFCSRDPLVQLLCYELVPNGSVDSWLHGSLREAHGPLDWPTRMKIALGSARGLHYLHEDSQPCVIHRDFKASNILLQNNFHAKVADFGLARLAPEGQGNYVSTRVMGTFGYVAPEYAMTGHLLVKSDVYSYGVVLLELLSGRKPIDYGCEDFENITAWARPLLTDRTRIHELADPRLEGKFPPEDFEQVAALAKTCIEPEWRARPTMGEVVATLNQICNLKEEYNTSSSDRDGATTSSEHETGNLRSVGLGGIPLRLQIPSTSTSSTSSSVFSMPWLDRKPNPSSSYVSDVGPSASTPSSGQFVGLSGLVQDPSSRTKLLSEDLQEGR